MPRLPYLLLLLVAASVALAACRKEVATVPDGDAAAQSAARKAFQALEHRWREQRLARLLAPDGWASLIGLHWLEPGSHYVGSAPGSGIRLRMGPPQLGLFSLAGGRVRFVPDGAAQLTLNGEPLSDAATLRSDMAEGGPDVVGFDGGKGKLTVIERAGRYALRVKHADAPSRTGFRGLEYWPADPDWRIRARFVPHPPGQTIEIASIIGTTEPVANPGAIEFERDGRTWRIEAQDEGEGELFLVFADRTNGHGSYGAGRFLYAPMPDASGHVVVDFNQAYNPPCAFTAFATCPLPPPENRLDLAITAGEKAYREGGDEDGEGGYGDGGAGEGRGKGP